MGVFIHLLPKQYTIFDWQPQIFRGGGWPTGGPVGLDHYILPVDSNGELVELKLRPIKPGTSINTNSIQVNVQPLPLGTYMSFVITPTITGSGLLVTVSFSIGNKQGEVLDNLHDLTITATDNQGLQGGFRFYYYKIS